MACYGSDRKSQEKEPDEEKKPREKEAEEKDDMTSSESDSDSDELIALKKTLRSHGNPDGNVISCCCVSRTKRPIRTTIGENKRKYELEQPVKKELQEDDIFAVEDCCSDDDFEQGIWYKYNRAFRDYGPPSESLISYANLAIDSFNKHNSTDYCLVEVVRAIAHLVEEVKETETVVNGAYYRMILEVKLPNQDDFDAVTLYAEYNTGVFGNGKVELVRIVE